ncbi:uncharacterized protein YndB with AHSA1/START domain [Rhizomicrobium palustre]|uniref:Uncharacterized protein YndB with AHSA1/START domain n=1 Tax=Rhizomicrobium palustre TaxID=189966 RepID=A0A846MWX7_9PROT|nr:uncharacterized protein YndB with AHSA1/START domain [Rhizomicrobium palustre]
MDAAKLDLEKRSLIVSRVFDAPRQMVFDAFTDPAHLAHWWGPKGFTITTHRFEFRKGGVWRLTMHGPDGRDYENYVTFEEVTPPSRLVMHYGTAEEEQSPTHHDTTITFEDLGGRTKLTLFMVFPTAEQRDMVVRDYKAEEGGNQTLGRLAEFLEADLFVISRVFKAPRPLVWKMYTEIEHLKNWWGPKGFEWLGGTIDLKPGGMFHYGMKAPNGSEMWGRFIFHEIKPIERLTYVNSFSDAQGGITRAPFFDNWPLEVFNVMTLEEEGEATRMTLRGAPINAREDERARFKSHHASMQQGFGASFQALEDYLAKQKS